MQEICQLSKPVLDVSSASALTYITEIPNCEEHKKEPPNNQPISFFLV